MATFAPAAMLNDPRCKFEASELRRLSTVFFQLENLYFTNSKEDSLFLVVFGRRALIPQAVRQVSQNIWSTAA